MTDTPVRSYADANRELEESFVWYMVARNMAATTVHEYEDAVRKLRDQFGARSLVEADHSDIREFMRKALKHSVADVTINKQTFGLRAFFKFLQFGGLIQGNPMQAISYRKLKHRLPRVC